MIRAVLDANVLAPGLLSTTTASGRIIGRWRERGFELVLSDHLIDELDRTYADPYFRQRIADDQQRAVARLLRRRAVVTELTIEVSGVASHPEDDLVLATAVSGEADYLVTHDKRLLGLGSFRGVRIIAPGRFLALLEAEECDGVP